MKRQLRNFAVRLFRLFGNEIRDCRTGESLGRGLVIGWGSRIHFLGFEDPVLVPVPMDQKRITYWHQRLGFTRHPQPDFPRQEPALSLLGKSPPADVSPQVLLVLLDHRPGPEVMETVRMWTRHGVSETDILVAYGGSPAGFEQLPALNKIFVSNPRLQTRDHQRELQSYRAVFSGVSQWLKPRPFTHVLFMEYDQIPLAADPVSEFLKTMASCDADVLCHRLRRLDGTIHPHWLGLPKVKTSRPEVLSMMGTGHLWKRAAWDAVAALNTFNSWYLELDLPTSAHELGFRVCGIPEQDPFVTNLPENLPFSPQKALAAGAWTLHPVKTPAPTSASGHD